MDSQKLFDDIVKFQRKQWKKSTRDGTAWCLYRHPDGLKCAVGCVMPDNMYDADMDEIGVFSDIMELYPDLAKYFGMENLALLQYMQSTHDCHLLKQWETCWQYIAYMAGLTYTAPAEVR